MIWIVIIVVIAIVFYFIFRSGNLKFTALEFSAITKLATLMIASDGVTKDEEFKILFIEFKAFDVPQNHIDTIFSAAKLMNANEVKGIVKQMSYNKKKYICSLLATIIVIDGDVDDNELALWRTMTQEYDLPKMTLKEGLAHYKSMRS